MVLFRQFETSPVAAFQQIILIVPAALPSIVAGLFDERDEAVRKLLSMTISACRKLNKYVGICGQGPSDHPDFARWLLDEGIGSMSLNPDTVVETWMFLAGDSPAANAGVVTPGGVPPTAKARN